jgi:DNA oxidative demethylase
MTLGMPLDIRGVKLWRGALAPDRQQDLMIDVAQVLEAAPPVHPVTPWGKQMSVGMTSAGRFGWTSDRRGYRYAATRSNGEAWPEIPATVLKVWDEFTRLERRPDCCLVNLYRGAARMGLHQDRDEASFDWPVLSISLGDDALFRIGDTMREGPTASVWLASGDVLVMEGAARLIHHGIDRIRPGTSGLVPDGGRINLTLRVVD